MNFTVIAFTSNGGICQESFATQAEAVTFDERMLLNGCTTSGVLGDALYPNEEVDEYIPFF